MRAFKTFLIGAAVALLSLVQLVLTGDPIRLLGLGIGVFFVIFGWKVGWTRHRGVTALLGHVALTAGCLVTAWAVYQLPFLQAAPTLLEVLDLPLFWGLFTACGGWCMITHSSCACCIRQHETRQKRAPLSPPPAP